MSNDMPVISRRAVVVSAVVIAVLLGSLAGSAVRNLAIMPPASGCDPARCTIDYIHDDSVMGIDMRDAQGAILDVTPADLHDNLC